MRANVRHALGKCNIGQVTAFGKSAIVDTFHTIRDGYAGQAVTSIKCATANTRHAAGDCNTRQTVTFQKCTAANACHTLRNRYTYQICAPRKCRFSNVLNSIFYDNIPNLFLLFATRRPINLSRSLNHQCSIFIQRPKRICAARAKYC